MVKAPKEKVKWMEIDRHLVFMLRFSFQSILEVCSSGGSIG